ncbi:L-threonylcarbamoyladenylate synthase [uncultured Methylobacterium sp.]|uniref:L-threonylcarbamoyladenylate synthase n=1 Tax=uncultured Methylobacterium sp. TaxID=157278 RepID=UPI0035CB5CDC
MNHLGSIPDRSADARTLRLSSDREGMTLGARLLREGRLVAFPTETVYGLGADATNASAVAGIFEAKERPRFNPLIAHVPNLAAARCEGVFDEVAVALAEAFWPGPLTVVVPASDGGTVCDLARAGLASVALRVPGSALARDLLAAVGRPVAAPSANRSGRLSPTSAAHVLADLDGRIAAVIDGGSAPVGLESTVVACLGGRPRLLRPGGVTRDALERVLGDVVDGPDDPVVAAPVAPGLLASHYAPRARVRLEAVSVERGEAVLLFGAERPAGLSDAVAWEDLSRSGDLVEAAAGLFAALRRLDATGADVIAVGPIPRTGLGEAINNRLHRAAAAR